MIRQPRTLEVRFIAVGFILFVGVTCSSVFARDPGDHAAFQAVNFPPAARLNRDQYRILTSYLDRKDSSPVPGLDQSFSRGVDTGFDEWSQNHNGRAATFLAVTHALSKATFHLDGQNILGTELIRELKKTLGDRIIVTLHRDLFDRWQTAGGRYTFHLANGKTEEGRINITPGGNLGGSLHHGYDRQGYTSNTRVPRLQINYRDRDSEADIDLDGYSPWKFGFIPNPNHLTWENSDVRYWHRRFVKKFGHPGFEVTRTLKRSDKSRESEANLEENVDDTP